MKPFIGEGTYSIVLSDHYYKQILPQKEGKFVKFTTKKEYETESRYIQNINEIRNHSEYYSICNEIKFVLKKSDFFYKSLQTLINSKMSIFKEPLYYYYIDIAGDKELYDIINDLIDNDYSFWNSESFFGHFCNHILEGVSYLHSKKICHLDIKPENIMVDTTKKTFKIIDFGYASIEPFDDFVNHFRGSPGYFPKQFRGQEISHMLPFIKANDMIPIEGGILCRQERSLVYKIDSYCFGRTLYELRSAYFHNKPKTNYWACISFANKNKKKLDSIIKDLLDNDVYKRKTISYCLDKYFRNKKVTIV